MMTLNFRSAMAVTVLMASAFAFQSCGSDEPDDPKKNLPSENDSEFVGGWQGSMGKLLFFNDGNAKLNGDLFGKWTFDNETKILATTLDAWQFVITLTSDDQWAAIAASGTGTYTFNRLEPVEYAYELMHGATYEAEDGESGVCGSLINERIGTSSFSVQTTDALQFEGLHGYIAFEDDGDGKDNTFNYTLYSREYKYVYKGSSYYYFQVQHKGTSVFSDMHSSTKCKLDIKSNSSNPENVIQHTFTLKNVASEK